MSLAVLASPEFLWHSRDPWPRRKKDRRDASSKSVSANSVLGLRSFGATDRAIEKLGACQHRGDKPLHTLIESRSGFARGFTRLGLRFAPAGFIERHQPQKVGFRHRAAEGALRQV